jgi:excisionase family DNA binding protein
MPDTIRDEMLTTQQAADLLGVKPGTLEVWRATKRYPLPFVKVGAAVRYRKSALLRFIEARTQAAA